MLKTIGLFIFLAILLLLIIRVSELSSRVCAFEKLAASAVTHDELDDRLR